MAKKPSAAVAAGTAMGAAIAHMASAAAPPPVIETVPAATVPAPAARRGKKAGKASGVRAARAGAGAGAALDRSDYTHAVWFGASARPKLWLKDIKELATALGEVPASKLKNVHVAQLRRVTLKITPTLEE